MVVDLGGNGFAKRAFAAKPVDAVLPVLVPKEIERPLHVAFTASLELSFASL